MPQSQRKCLFGVIYWSPLIRQEDNVIDEADGLEWDITNLRLSEEVGSWPFHYTVLCFLQSTKQGKDRSEPSPEEGGELEE